MCAILEPIKECYTLVCTAQAATEVENSIVIIQRKTAEELFQRFEAVSDFRRIRFVGFGIGLVKLIQDGFAAAITTIKGVGIYVSS